MDDISKPGISEKLYTGQIRNGVGSLAMSEPAAVVCGPEVVSSDSSPTDLRNRIYGESSH